MKLTMRDMYIDTIVYKVDFDIREEVKVELFYLTTGQPRREKITKALAALRELFPMFRHSVREQGMEDLRC